MTPALASSQPVSPQPDSMLKGYGCVRNVFAAEDEGVKSGEVAGEDAVDDTEEIIESKEEEVDPARTAPTPYLPSQQEVDEHCVDHVPYRCWCDHCVNGFGREDGHGSESSGRTTPLISFDYMFMTQSCIFERGEWGAVTKKKSF